MERELEAVNTDSDSIPDLNSHDKSAKVSQSPTPSSASASGSWEEPGYFSGYLKRMPRQERRKIQKEIQKGHKPGQAYKLLLYIGTHTIHRSHFR